jgi:hypothetical protein
MRAEALVLSDQGNSTAGRARRLEWIGLAVIALLQCGMPREEIRRALGAGDDEIVRRIWSCFGSLRT